MKNYSFTYSIIFCLLVILKGQAVIAAENSQSKQTIRYQVTFTDPAHHLLQVKMHIPRGYQQLSLKLPAWRTGNYKILNMANGISHFSARSKRYGPLAVTKLDSSRWQISNPKNDAFVVSYEIYANELGYRTRSLTDNHFYFDASAVFVYADEFRESPVRVELDLPDGWQAVSGMPSPAKGVFTALNYDVLVDSPIEGGVIELRQFRGKKKYTISGWGTSFFDYKKIEEDVKKIELAAEEIWGGFPFENYLIILHDAPGIGGATEHLNSTVMQSSWVDLDKRENYLRFIGTLSHEYVHTWNVKAYRAKAIAPYEYQHPSYTNLLWLEEGATSYYDGLLNFRAKVINQKEFLNDLARSVNAYLNRPGTEHRSVSEASFDWWTKQSGEFDHNRSVSIYNEGKIASLALDFWMRETSENKVSFDRLHRKLYEKFRLDHDKLATQQGFTESDLKQLVAELVGVDSDEVEKVWRKILHSHEKLDLAALLTKAGLQVVSAEKADKVNPEWKLRYLETGARVDLVSEGGPAWEAGIASGDIIIAIDKMAVNEKIIGALSQGRFRQSSLVIDYLRGGRLLQTSIKTAGNQRPKKIIKPVDNPSQAQLEFFKAWTGHALQLKKNSESDKTSEEQESK